MIEDDLFIIILGFRRLSLSLALEQRLERLRLEDPLAGGLRGKGWLWRPEDEIVVENDARLLATSLSSFVFVITFISSFVRALLSMEDGDESSRLLFLCFFF